MADKLLLVTMFVMLTLPGIGSANRLPLWLTVLVISRDIAIVADRGGRQPGGRAAHVPAVDLRQDRHRDLHRDRRRRRCTSTTSAGSLSVVTVFVYASLAITRRLGVALRWCRC